MTAVASAPLSMMVQKSPWHSPVPYLFGGLAAMLGLIAFALLILACSYWKLSGYLESDEGSAQRDLEAGAGESSGDCKFFGKKFLVIMAGQEKPTYLATPISGRTQSFGNNSSCSTETSQTTEKSDEKVGESKNDESVDQVERSIMHGEA